MKIEFVFWHPLPPFAFSLKEYPTKKNMERASIN
jgi:hypothetical protein